MSEQQTPQPLQDALDRLLGVQLIDNTAQDAREARQELRDIMTDMYKAATRAAYEDAAKRERKLIEALEKIANHETGQVDGSDVCATSLDCWACEQMQEIADGAIRARAEAQK